jgi:amino acid transporter
LLLSVVLWNTCGWDNAACCAGEVQQPGRFFPKAMATTVVLVTLSYLLPVAVGVGVDQQWSAWKEGHFPLVAARIGGPYLGTWLMIAGVVSAMGLFNSLLCTSARIPYALARQQLLPPIFAQLHPRFGTPWAAILVNSVIVTLLIAFSFQTLIELDMFLYALALIPEFAALIWLRFKEPQLHRPYRLPGGIPGMLALSCPPVLLCVISMMLAGSATKLVSLIGIVAGVLFFGIREISLPSWRQHGERVE